MKKKFIVWFFVVFALLMFSFSIFSFTPCYASSNPYTSAKGMVVIETKNNNILYSKNENETFPVEYSIKRAEGEFILMSESVLLAFTLLGKIAPININIYIIEKPFLILSPKI